MMEMKKCEYYGKYPSGVEMGEKAEKMKLKVLNVLEQQLIMELYSCASIHTQLMHVIV